LLDTGPADVLGTPRSTQFDKQFSALVKNSNSNKNDKNVQNVCFEMKFFPYMTRG
jgi:hypothetical protein